jgi:hypothetical protein
MGTTGGDCTINLINHNADINAERRTVLLRSARQTDNQTAIQTNKESDRHADTPNVNQIDRLTDRQLSISMTIVLSPRMGL